MSISKERGLRWGKDKTKAGTRRTIPISRRAMAMLEVWAENFPHRKPTHYVFPSEEYRQPKKGQKTGTETYVTDPTKHVISVQNSWGDGQRKGGLDTRRAARIETQTTGVRLPASMICGIRRSAA
jgi:hypothetical protein